MKDAQQQLKENVTKNKTEFLKKRQAVFLAMALNETNEDIDRKSKQAVLDAHTFKTSQENKSERSREIESLYKAGRITSPKHDYQMTDAEFARYSKLVHTERAKRGLHLKAPKVYSNGKPVPVGEWEDWNVTADCYSRPLLKKAENEFIDFCLSLMPDSLKADFKGIDIKNAHTYGANPYKDSKGNLQSFRQRFIEVNLRFDIEA